MKTSESKPTARPSKPDPKAPAPKRSNGGEDRPLRGLCVNCDEREFCKLPKAPAGVWFCEEYR